jgi:NAD(P)-dependent dehydrogenase (short-subunit alcohol dehydrogenase family)
LISDGATPRKAIRRRTCYLSRRCRVLRAADELGSVDILVSNVSTLLHTKFLDISIKEWQRILNSNLSASFYLARAALPLMKARGWGRIIHISGRDGFAVIPHTCRRNVRGDVRWRG